jgi:hypothetical protein
VDLFDKHPEMIQVETGIYIKGIHNLLSAHFDLKNFSKFDEELERFEAFSKSKLVEQNDNNRIQTFVYLATSKINKHFMQGTFNEGLLLVPYIEENLKAYARYLDKHRVLVFYYKIASLYFGSGRYEEAVDYLNKIINWKMDLRIDLQCYARLLHLIAHYELKNYDLIEYLAKSVYRFMAKMGNLSVVEEYMFEFLRESLRKTPVSLRRSFKALYDKLKAQELNTLEARAFSYLDILSWLESKEHNVPVQNIIRAKFLEKLNKKTTH